MSELLTSSKQAAMSQLNIAQPVGLCKMSSLRKSATVMFCCQGLCIGKERVRRGGGFGNTLFHQSPHSWRSSMFSAPATAHLHRRLDTVLARFAMELTVMWAMEFVLLSRPAGMAFMGRCQIWHARSHHAAHWPFTAPPTVGAIHCQYGLAFSCQCSDKMKSGGILQHQALGGP